MKKIIIIWVLIISLLIGMNNTKAVENKESSYLSIDEWSVDDDGYLYIDIIMPKIEVTNNTPTMTFQCYY